MKDLNKIGLITTTSIVVANMVGTGVFTSLGFQVVSIPSVFPLLLLWVIGGIVALCGALTYGELSAALPRSGGEYNLLGVIYHPAFGFLAGWVSVTVGFAAPAALAAIAFATYLKTLLPGIPMQHTAATAVVVFTIIHAASLRFGAYSHNLFTSLKIALIVGFIFSVFLLDQPQPISILPAGGDPELITSPGFAVSLIYVSFAYAGWNAAVYVAGDVKDPQQNLPKALFAGTLLVTILYFFLNLVFLYSVSTTELAGQIQVGYLAGQNIFGETGGKIMSLVISLLLISSISGHVFVGPRITQVMGEDYHALRLLRKKNSDGIPVNSFIFQLVLILILIYSATFEQLMIYAGFTLNLVTTMTVAGVFVLRRKRPDLPRPYKTWGYPVIPIIFLVMSAWTLTFVMLDKPVESCTGFGIVLLGLAVYFLNQWLVTRKQVISTG